MASRARRRAIAEAQIRYAPQQRVLLDALAEARSGAQATIRSARGTGSALQASIRRARKPLVRGYDEAAATAVAARGDLVGHLAGLGPAAAPFSAAVAREQAGVTSRSAQERARALEGLTLRGVQAAEGATAAELNARRQLASDRAKIFGQLQGVASDAGAFTAAQEEEIRAAQRDFQLSQDRLDLTASGQRETARHHRVGEAQAAARERRQARDRKKGKAEQQGSHKLKAQVIDARAEYERQLLRGTPMRRIAKNARKNGVPEHVLVAAADLAAHGYITPGHLRNLRAAGLTHVPRAWAHKPRRKPSTVRRGRQTQQAQRLGAALFG